MKFLGALISGDCLMALNEIRKYLSPETRLSSTLLGNDQRPGILLSDALQPSRD